MPLGHSHLCRSCEAKIKMHEKFWRGSKSSFQFATCWTQTGGKGRKESDQQCPHRLGSSGQDCRSGQSKGVEGHDWSVIHLDRNSGCLGWIQGVEGKTGQPGLVSSLRCWRVWLSWLQLMQGGSIGRVDIITLAAMCLLTFHIIINILWVSIERFLIPLTGAFLGRNAAPLLWRLRN